MTKLVPAAATLLLVTLAATTSAAAGSVGLRVTPDPVAIDQPLSVSVIVEGEDAGAASIPEIPDIPGLELHGAPRTATERRVSIDNGTMTQRKRQTIRLEFLATREGTITIPPLEVVVGKERVRTPERTVRVIASSGARTRPAPSSPRPDPFFDPFGGGRSGDARAPLPEMSVERRPSRSRVFLGEAFRLDTELWVGPAAGRLSGLDPMDLAPREGFWVERIELGPGTPRREVVRNGEPFTVFTVRSELMVPTEAGTRVLGPERWRVLFNPGSRSFLVRPEELYPRVPETRIEVLPWPATGRPDAFTGLVGHFALRGRVDRERARVGEALTWTLTLQGEGNLRTAGAIPEPAPEGAQVFSSRATEDVGVEEGRMSGTRTRELVLIPERAGELVLGPVSVPYLDPGSGSYRSAEVAALVIPVDPGEDGATERLGPRRGSAPRERAVDIRYLRPASPPLAPYRDPLRSGWTALGLAWPPLVLGVALARRAWQRRRGANGAEARRRRALARLDARLRRLGASPDLAGIARAVQVFLADRFDIPAVAVTASRLRGEARERGLAPEPVEELVRLLGELDHGRFGGVEADAAGLTERARELCRRLDREGGR